MSMYYKSPALCCLLHTIQYSRPPNTGTPSACCNWLSNMKAGSNKARNAGMLAERRTALRVGNEEHTGQHASGL